MIRGSPTWTTIIGITKETFNLVQTHAVEMKAIIL